MFFLISFSATVLLAMTFPICVKAQTGEVHVITSVNLCSGSGATPVVQEGSTNTSLKPTFANESVSIFTVNGPVNAFAFLSMEGCQTAFCPGYVMVLMILGNENPTPNGSVSQLLIENPLPSSGSQAPAVEIQYSNANSSDGSLCGSSQICDPVGFSKGCTSTSALFCKKENLNLNIYYSCP